MEVKDGRAVRHTRNGFVETKVRGIRADDDFWEMCDKFARLEATSRNELIIRVVTQYCTGELR